MRKVQTLFAETKSRTTQIVVAQMCDDMCKERILDGDHYVCPISGYSSARLVNEWEEATAAKADDFLDDGPEPGGDNHPPLCLHL